MGKDNAYQVVEMDPRLHKIVLIICMVMLLCPGGRGGNSGDIGIFKDGSDETM